MTRTGRGGLPSYAELRARVAQLNCEVMDLKACRAAALFEGRLLRARVCDLELALRAGGIDIPPPRPAPRDRRRRIGDGDPGVGGADTIRPTDDQRSRASAPDRV